MTQKSCFWMILLCCASQAGLTQDSTETSESAVQQDHAPAPFFGGPVPRTEFIADDTTLNDVCGIGNHCWAVGERGVLLRSSDAGVSWESGFVPIDCTLRSVCFLTDQIGYVAGSWFDAYSRRHRGVVLTTRDGGDSWTNLARHVEVSDQNSGKLLNALAPVDLPPLSMIRFFDLENAVAVASPDRMNSGSLILKTEDGGATWTPCIRDNDRIRWITGDFLSNSDGIVVGQGNASGAVVGNKVITLQQPAPSLRAIRGASLHHDGTGWMAGDGGTLLGSSDGGVTWKPSSLHPLLNDVMDYQTVDHVGSTICVAGSPGSVVLRSGDGGQSWTFGQLATRAPIHRVRFVGPSTVIAVGALGVIHRSENAGLSWAAVRNESYRTAVMSLVSNTDDVSFRVLADLGGDQGFRAVVVQPSGRLPRPGVDDSLTAEHIQSAVARSGGNEFSLDWMFSRTQPMQRQVRDELMDAWSRQTDGRVSELLPQRLARHIRIWQPDVILVEAGFPKDAVAESCLNALDEARRLASGADGKENLLDKVGLKPWTVARVVVRQPQGTNSSLSFSDEQLLPNLGTTSGLIVEFCRSCAAVFTELATIEISRSSADTYHSFTTDGAVATPRHLLEGSHSAPGSDSRRRIRTGTEREALERLAQRSRTERAALAGHLKIARTPLSIIARLKTIGDGLPQHLALQQLKQLSELYASHQNIEGQIAVLKEIAQRFPDSPEAADAAEQLFQFYSSQEIRFIRWKSGQRDTYSENSNLIQVAGSIPGIPLTAANDLQPTGNNFPPNGITLSVDASDGRGSLLPNSNGRDSAALSAGWDRQADVFLEQLTRLSPDRGQSSPILLRKAANVRQQGALGANRTILSQAATSDGVYALLARAEMQAVHGATAVPVPTVNLPKATSKPFLDAQMTELCWQGAAELHLKADKESNVPRAPDCLIMFAWDDDHLYISGRIACARGHVGRLDPTAARVHDAEHGDRDRVMFSFDTDRDYTTAFHFTIDEAGQTSERCWRVTDWDPVYYVSEGADDNAWRFEIAIPQSELGTPIRAGDLWAIKIQRLVPGILEQSLTNPIANTAEASTEGFGLLRFIRSN